MVYVWGHTGLQLKQSIFFSQGHTKSVNSFTFAIGPLIKTEESKGELKCSLSTHLERALALKIA